MADKISNKAVKKSTGKIWSEWFALLTKAGARKMEHKAIAEMLHEKQDLSSWWSQMITVQYEQEIKGRKKHEKPGGYQITKSKTLPCSVLKIFNAVQSPAQRKSWLKNHKTITKSTKNKSIRGKWVDGKTNLEFQFYQKDTTKTQIAIQHSKISSAKGAEKMKKYWEINLTNLKNFLENK
jgi:hypothetical protein